ncbi:MAG TPA: hypothetical protein VGJ60_26915 [Chloroflexota bacterium]|jgi:hypothetical protein
MQIEERIPCPRCGHGRVIQRARHAYLCFQCRFGWSADAEQARTTTEFLGWCPPSLRDRLVAYRAAIRAGLYSDWPASSRLS